MSLGTESVAKIEQAKRAVGSILNLIRYQPLGTLEEAKTRLRLLDEFALDAFHAISEVENAEYPGTEHSNTPRSSAIHFGQEFPEVASNLGVRH